MSEDFGSLGIDNRPRIMTFAVLLLASPPNAASGKRNVMQNCHAIRLFTAVACCCKRMIKSGSMKIDVKSFVLLQL